jgi:6-phosphogluconolactonase
VGLVVALAWLCAACGRIGFAPLPAADRQILYYPTSLSTGVAAYALDATSGAVTEIGTFGSFATQEGVAVRVASDSLARFAYVADHTGSAIYVFAIDPASGALAPLAGSPFSGNGVVHPTGMAVGPHDDRLYVANLGNNSLSIFAIAADGGLVADRNLAPSWLIAPQDVIVDPSGKYLYVALGDNNGGIGGFSIEGLPAAITGSPWQLEPAAGPDVFQLAFHPSGRWLFGSDQSNGHLLWAAFDAASGALSPQPTQISAGNLVNGLAFDPAGARVYEAACGGPVAVLVIDVDPATGAQTGPRSTNYPQACPWGIAIEPSGSYLYATDRTGLFTYTLAQDGSLVLQGVADTAHPAAGLATLVTITPP